jgi:hypothetical protein
MGVLRVVSSAERQNSFDDKGTYVVFYVVLSAVGIYRIYYQKAI